MSDSKAEFKEELVGFRLITGESILGTTEQYHNLVKEAKALIRQQATGIALPDKKLVL